ncbi:MAG TPA: translation elongation factor 4, partial [Chloroflexia bacterium]|nr:translation elongation factor 4 [Chloroflexia bacterium]
RIKLMATEATYETTQLGAFTPANSPREALEAGEVGYIIAGIKELQAAKVGDTVTLIKPGSGGAAFTASEPLPGFKEVQPQVFAGLYPVEANQYDSLRDSLEKLKLNDASLHYEPEVSQALGFGFRCGFLGLLHMEIIRERLEREYNLALLVTAPNVEYKVTKTDGTAMVVDNPADMPQAGNIASIEEPWMEISIVTPTRYIGPIMDLVTARRGSYKKMDYLDEERVVLVYEMPLGELIVDFYDQLKSRTQGYASLDYQLAEYRQADLVKLDILVAGSPVDALSIITHREKAHYQGRQLVDRLRRLIPRQLFEVPIQAAIGSKIVARETISAMRKNVLAKCYGGDITRKRKLLEKQKEGKARMKMVGNVEIPQEAFMAVLALEEPAKS